MEFFSCMHGEFENFHCTSQMTDKVILDVTYIISETIDDIMGIYAQEHSNYCATIEIIIKNQRDIKAFEN
jgi:hypothetical protein